MADQEKKELELENLEVAELEDEDLEDVAGGGGFSPNTTINDGCPVNGNCPC